MFLETISPGSSTDGSETVGRKQNHEDWPWALFVIIICLILLVIVVMIIRQKQKTQQDNDCKGQKRQKESLDNGQKTSGVSEASKSAASNAQVETCSPPENKSLDEEQNGQKEPVDNGQKTSSVSKDQASISAASNAQVETSPPPENKLLDEEQKDGDNPNSLSLSTDEALKSSDATDQQEMTINEAFALRNEFLNSQTTFSHDISQMFFSALRASF